MSHVIICEVRPGALEKLKSLRLRHLEYINEHRADILFGGPARAESGIPETMIIVHKTSDRAEAERFIAGEPYTASGEVFSGHTIRPWSQVLPDLETAALQKAIEAEKASH